jgi:hypothetical protein
MIGMRRILRGRWRTGRARRLTLGLVSVAGVVLAGAVASSADVTTISVDNNRVGWFQNQPGVGPSNLPSIKHQFSTKVAGDVQGQPVTFGSTVIVATQSDMVYGVDRDSGAAKWVVRVGNAESTGSPGLNCTSTAATIGVTSTPVVDPSTGLVYLTALSWDGANTASGRFFMYALNATTGAVQPGWPVQLSATATNDSARSFTTDAPVELQRPGLLLLNGRVYASFAGNCDQGDYVGWIMSVSTSSRGQTGWVDEGQGNLGAGIQGGIWHSGGGLASDGTNIYFASGNGTGPPVGAGNVPTPYLGESVVRLAVGPNGVLTAADHFTPVDAQALSNKDLDLGSSGPVLLPPNFGGITGHQLVFQGGKTGVVYLLDRNNLGGQAAHGQPDNVVARLDTKSNSTWGHAAAWGGDGGGWLYLAPGEGGSALKVFRASLVNGTPTLSLAGSTSDVFGGLSGSPVITSNGSNSGSGVLWVLDRLQNTSNPPSVAELRAYNPVPVNGTLQLLKKFPIASGTKFSVIGADANQVFLGSQDGNLVAYSASGRTSPAMSGIEATDGSLRVKVPGPSGFTNLGGVLTGAPAVAAVPQAGGPLTPLYLVTGADHVVYVRSSTQGWQRLTPASTECLDNPAAVVTGNTLTVGCQGGDHQLWMAQGPVAAGGLPSLNGWTPLGGVLTAGPAVAQVPGTIGFFVTGQGGRIWSRGPVSGWGPFPWTCTGHPAVATAGSTSTFACHGGGNQVFYATNTGGGWSAAKSAGGVAVDGPGVAATGSGALLVIEGGDNAMYVNFLPNGGTPAGWAKDSGVLRQGAAAAGLG